MHYYIKDVVTISDFTLKFFQKNAVKETVNKQRGVQTMGMEIRGLSSRLGSLRNQRQISEIAQEETAKASARGNSTTSRKVSAREVLDTLELQGRLNAIDLVKATDEPAETENVTAVTETEETKDAESEKASEQLVQEFIEAFENYDYTLDEAKAYLESIGAKISDAPKQNKLVDLSIGEKLEFTIDGKQYSVERLRSPKNETEKLACKFCDDFANGQYTLMEAKAYLQSIGIGNHNYFDGQNLLSMMIITKTHIKNPLQGARDARQGEEGYITEEISFYVGDKKYTVTRTQPLSETQRYRQLGDDFVAAFENGEYTNEEAEKYLRSIGATDIEVSEGSKLGLKERRTVSFRLNCHTYEATYEKSLIPEIIEKMEENNTEKTSGREQKSSNGILGQVGDFLDGIGSTVADVVDDVVDFFRGLF